MTLALRAAFAIGALWAAGCAAFGQTGEVPQLRVRIYGNAAVSPQSLRFAEYESERMLSETRILLNWLDCLGAATLPACMSEGLPTDLMVRIQQKEPPEAGRGVGMTVLNGEWSVAFIFYGRVLALRSNGAVPQAILGRVMAHEITHILLPREGHSGAGLMRERWKPDDLQFRSPACLGLPPRFVRLMEQEALRRVEAARIYRPGGDSQREIARSARLKPAR